MSNQEIELTANEPDYFVCGDKVLEQKITYENALKDVLGWLDFRRTRKQKRKDGEIFIKRMIEAVQYGLLKIEKDFNLIQTLEFPYGKEAKITELKFKVRVTVAMINERTKGAEGSEIIIRTASALTGREPNVLRQMDTEDYSVTSAVSYFFLG